MKRILLTFLGMVMLLAVHATGFETIKGLKYLINTDDQTATLVADTVKYSGDIVVPEKVALAGIDYPVVAFAKECFSICTSLTSVTIPSSVTSLGDDCFYGCTSLTSITIPSSVTILGASCFAYCTHLSSITIPASVTSLGQQCFENCESLLFLTIPSSVTSLGDWCFHNCRSLTSIRIPSSVTSLGEQGCFHNCRSLKSIIIPPSVTDLGYECFQGCSSLTSISIPSSVTSLGENCFSFCSSLASITIPSSVQSVGSGCFLDCTKLGEVYCYAANPPKASELQQPSTTILYVPATSIDKYKQANGWQDFSSILAIKGTEPQNEQCSKPVITYSNKNLYFESSTIGVTYHYTISSNDMMTDQYSNDGKVSLAAAYNITAYATADNYSPSEKVTATLHWVDGSLDDPTGINAAKTRGVLASSDDGIVTLSGLNDGETVAFYTTDGKIIGNAKSVNGVASYAVGNEPIVIVKFGASSIKIAVNP